MRRLVLTCLIVLGLCTPAFARRPVYTIAIGHPFPPWDVGPLVGIDVDIVAAVCRANAAMRCRVVDLPYAECVASDVDGRSSIGPALASGRVDGCMGWFVTPERQQLGAEFTDGYSLGPTPQLIAADTGSGFDGLGAGGSLGGAGVGIIAGSFNSPACLERAYTDFDPIVFDNSQAGRDAMIAALRAGGLGLVFWDSLATVPPGTHVVGAPIANCGPHLSLIVYPPRTGGVAGKSDELRRDFNCGLALIRASGVLAGICASSPYPGGDPACLLDGPAPTVQCLQDQSGADGLDSPRADAIR